jgi:AcrR family transcriptional regulator
MPIKHRQTTKDRILTAAREELLAFGSAGARVDRIAERAKTSKERIYHYYRSKDALADEVWIQQAIGIQEKVKFDPEDIDGFIGSLFDYYFDNPEEVRLWLWFLLERGGTSLPEDDFRVAAVQERIESVKLAQKLGYIDPAWNPILLLNMISSLAVSRVIAPVYVHEVGKTVDRDGSKRMGEQHRAAVIEIVHTLLANAPKAEGARQ